MRAAHLLCLAALVACSDSTAADPCGASSSPCPATTGAPTFGGAVAVAPDATGNQLRVVWRPANDDKTPPERIKYRVYAAQRPDRAGRGAPLLETSPGATSVYVTVAPAGIAHYFVVRAVDEDGLEDANVVEKSAVATPDGAAPTFAGAKGSAPVPNGGVELSWDPATDDRSPTEAITYVVYGGEGDLARLAETEPGATKIALAGLGPDGAAWKFSVRARDAAGHEDANTVILSAKLGPDGKAPTYAGCGAVEAGGHEVSVSWAAATDDVTAPDGIAYEVRIGRTQAEVAGSQPVAKVTGATSALVPNLDPATPYFLSCKAIDAAGNVDANTAVVPVTTDADGTAPSFGGATAVTVDPTVRTAKLEWTAATDDKSQAAAIVYDVYQRKGAAPFDFAAKPVATSAPGAASVNVTALPPDTTLAWVVRARDAARNRDANTKEVTGATDVSFALQVQPLFAQDCAVVGCHTSGFPTGGLSLAHSVMYDSLVNVPAAQRPPGRPTPINRITPGLPAESYLYLKVIGTPGTIVGNQMPAPGTGSVLDDGEKNVLKRWIEQGAPRN